MDKTPTVSVAASAAAVKEASLVSSELMAPTIPLVQWIRGVDWAQKYQIANS